MPSVNSPVHVYLCIRTEPVPESRIDLGCEITDIVGAYATEEAAQQAALDDAMKRSMECMRGDGYASLQDYAMSDDFYDPNADATYTTKRMEIQ
jgi:hypothetical protein